jgi:hypothetical protein
MGLYASCIYEILWVQLRLLHRKQGYCNILWTLLKGENVVVSVAFPPHSGIPSPPPLHELRWWRGATHGGTTTPALALRHHRSSGMEPLGCVSSGGEAPWRAVAAAIACGRDQWARG